MSPFDPALLKDLYVPSSDSHKGQNGKVMLIAGSKLFHAASIWPLTVMSRMCDMVFYASTSDNNELVAKLKEQFVNGIVIPREKIDDYIRESDCILIGPGMPREEGIQEGDDDTKVLTESLLTKYKDKKWVVDGGSLQVVDPALLPQGAIVTPHQREFEILKGNSKKEIAKSTTEEEVIEFAKTFGCTVLYKGERDIVSNGDETVTVSGGNAGMTKGGTGDVLAGLVASLFAKNDAYLSACAASYINKKAGEGLEKSMGIYFNASDLASEIPKVMRDLL